MRWFAMADARSGRAFALTPPSMTSTACVVIMAFIVLDRAESSVTALRARKRNHGSENYGECSASYWTVVKCVLFRKSWVRVDSLRSPR